MTSLPEKYYNEAEESLSLLYQERDRIRRNHKGSKKRIRTKMSNGTIGWLEARAQMRSLRERQKAAMDSIFEKIRECKKTLIKYGTQITRERE